MSLEICVNAVSAHASPSFIIIHTHFRMTYDLGRTMDSSYYTLNCVLVTSYLFIIFHYFKYTWLLTLVPSKFLLLSGRLFNENI